jgi:hypothetical protein
MCMNDVKMFELFFLILPHGNKDLDVFERE